MAKKKKQKQSSMMPVALIAFIVAISVIAVLVGNLFEKDKSSKKHVTDTELKEIFKLYDGYTEENGKVDFSGATEAEDNQVAIELNDELVNDRAIIEDGRIYLEYNFLKENVDDKFYWDSNENVLLYTTPTDVIKAELGAQEYSVSKVKTPVDYQIVKSEGDDTYIAIEYVALYSNMTYNYLENPNRLLLRSEWDVTASTATLKKNVVIRKENSIKSNIVYKCTESTEVVILDKGDKWSKVVTNDGWFGYVKNSSLNKQSEKTYTNDYTAPEYTTIRLDKTLSLGWQMTTSTTANNQLVDLVTNAKGMNVVAPTWYRISDNEGNMTSLAESGYVTRAHMLGLDVWAVVDDQSGDSSNDEIFTYTSKREKIINQLIADAINYGIDGINVDFEYITEDVADDYIEFIRELSVKCRINGIVLSVDDKNPEVSNYYYNLKAQGEVADYVILMGYDEHWGTESGAGSVASLPWVTSGVEYAVSQMDSSKVVLGVPFYTRVWTEDSAGNLKDSETADMQAAMDLLTSHGITPWWVEEYGQNYGEYTEGENTVRIWVEDATSIEAKLKLLSQYSLGGMAAWRLGLENTDIWNTIIKYTN